MSRKGACDKTPRRAPMRDIYLPEPADSFDRFCQGQLRRVMATLAGVRKRIIAAKRPALLEAAERWETRGRVAGFCGLQKPIDEE